MDLRQLRYFIALTEYRSFVRAAEAMGITQPAFSRAIQGLEQTFGCPLVDRASKALLPTPEGLVVLQHARRLVQGAAQLSNEVLQMTKLDAGELHFGSGPALAVRLVPDALRHFIERHPGIRTSLLVDNAERLGQALRREQIEFFVDDIRPFEADPNFHTEPLSPRPGLFFCRPGHPLLAKDSLSTNDLFSYPLASALLAPGAQAPGQPERAQRLHPAPADRAPGDTAQRGAGQRRHWHGQRGGRGRRLGRRHTCALALAQPAAGTGGVERALRRGQPQRLPVVAGGAGDDRDTGGAGYASAGCSHSLS